MIPLFKLVIKSYIHLISMGNMMKSSDQSAPLLLASVINSLCHDAAHSF